ncbi:MAG: CotH kinase family protein [Erysipelotrichaceae bacterium]|nr:CotH kinase family protein [Erysipelotrichaceae bacterium]
MGKNKHWVLLANYLDYTLLRDRVTSYLAGNMSFAFTPECVNVEVYMKDVKDDQLYYLGNYMLAEQVRVGENRLEIDELDENETDPTKITGGYLIQEGSQRHLSRDVFKTKLASLTLANDAPSFDTKDEGYENDTQMNYIREHIQHYEDALYGDDFINDQGLSCKDYADQLTAADYFLMNVISANVDAFATGSHYFYKVSDTFDESGKLKEMGKIYYGPIWDYDKCWGIDLTNSTDSEEGRYQTLRNFDPDDRWFKAMLTDPEFTALLKQRWSLFRADLLDIIADGGLIDQYYQENKASQADDFAFWFEGENVYQEEIIDFKKRIAYRINWVDDHFDELNDMIHSVKCVVDGNVFSKNFYSIHDYAFLDTPQKEGCIFVGWLDEKGNVIEEVEDLSYDRVFTASFINKKDASKADEIYFERKEVYGLPGDHRWARYTLFPEDALDKSVIWESLDENVATVDEKGTLTLHALGRAKITATLASGVQISYYVNVVNEKPLIETIQIPESITLKKGAHCQLEVRYVPEDAEYDFVSYGTDDIDIIRIDDNGVIKGLNKGSGVVQVRATYNDYQKHIEIAVEKECVVHVTDEEEYNCTDGSGKEWIRGGASGLAFEFKNSDDDANTYDRFRKLYLDNHEADKNRYDTERGSLIVKLKPEYLNSLSKGEHILIAEFEDGKALTRFTINERPTDTSYRIPVTGIR